MDSVQDFFRDNWLIAGVIAVAVFLHFERRWDNRQRAMRDQRETDNYAWDAALEREKEGLLAFAKGILSEQRAQDADFKTWIESRFRGSTLKEGQDADASIEEYRALQQMVIEAHDESKVNGKRLGELREMLANAFAVMDRRFDQLGLQVPHNSEFNALVGIAKTQNSVMADVWNAIQTMQDRLLGDEVPAVDPSLPEAMGIVSLLPRTAEYDTFAAGSLTIMPQGGNVRIVNIPVGTHVRFAFDALPEETTEPEANGTLEATTAAPVAV